MSDIHQGFQQVDQRAESERFFRFLDAASALESVQAYRQRMLEFAPPTGKAILDVGCGIGHAAQQLAPLVGATCSVTGVDKSTQLLAEAVHRAQASNLAVTYQFGDATQLQFAAQSFDICRTERVLMYIAHPQQVIDHMLRVLRPGGMLLAFEFDYDGIVVDAPDQALTRQLMRYVADTVPSLWIGRQLPRLLRERGYKKSM